MKYKIIKDGIVVGECNSLEAAKDIIGKMNEKGYEIKKGEIK